MGINELDVDIFGVDEEDLQSVTGFVPTYVRGEGESPDIGLEGRVINLNDKMEGHPSYDLLIVEDRIKDAEKILEAAAEVNEVTESTMINKVGFCYGCPVFEEVIERLDRGPRTLILDFELRPGLEHDADYANKTAGMYKRFTQKKGWKSTSVIGLTMYEDSKKFNSLVNTLRSNGDNVFKKGDPDETKVFLPKLIKNALEKSRLQAELEKTRTEVDALDQIIGPDYDLVGPSTELDKAKRYARRVATTSNAILLIGEVGTQKKDFAKYIHALSRREKFERVNCASVTGENALSHENKNERVTFLLENIDQLSIMQQKRVVEVSEYDENIGIIASSNEDLYKLVKEGEFLDELYFVIDIEIPPLRKRRKDIVPLAKHFLEQVNNREEGLSVEGFNTDAKKLLEKQDWKRGDVEALKREITKSAFSVGEEGKVITPKHLSINNKDKESDKKSEEELTIPLSSEHNYKKLQTAKEWLDDLESALEIELDTVPKTTQKRIINKIEEIFGREVTPQRLSQIFSTDDDSSSLREEIKLLMEENPNRWTNVRKWRKNHCGDSL